MRVISPDVRPRLATGARLQPDKVSGKLALLYPEGVLLLNPTGAAILELCDGQHTFDEVVTALGARFDAQRDLLAADVAEFLQRLRDRRLLEPPPEGVPP